MKKLIAFLGALLICGPAAATSTSLDLTDQSHYGIFDDFIGAYFSIVVSGSAANPYTWIGTCTNTTFATEVLHTVDADFGTVTLSVDNSAGADGVLVDMGNQLLFDLGDAPRMVVRFNITTAPTTAENFAIGFSGDASNNADPDAVTEKAVIHFDAALTPKLQADNDVTSTTSFDIATWYEVMVDCTSLTSVKFYYRTSTSSAWTRIVDASTTDVVWTSSGNVQPAIWLYQSTGTTEPTVVIDYIKAWATR